MSHTFLSNAKNEIDPVLIKKTNVSAINMKYPSLRRNEKSRRELLCICSCVLCANILVSPRRWWELEMITLASVSVVATESECRYIWRWPFPKRPADLWAWIKLHRVDEWNWWIFTALSLVPLLSPVVWSVYVCVSLGRLHHSTSKRHQYDI